MRAKAESPTPRVGLSLMAEPDFRDAAEPLLAEDGAVEIAEWTLDNGWAARAQGRELPAWCVDTLERFSSRGTLYGHGFSFSPLSGKWTERHDIWLALLRREVRQRRYRHISEHFCFVTAEGFSHSAPLPVPLTERTLRMGQERMRRLADAAGMRVGLENLAIAFGERDVRAQGQFLGELLAPIDGFVLLDLHNLYCQLHNFDMSADDLLASYPLARVTELHLSGGSCDSPSATRAPSGATPTTRRCPKRCSSCCHWRSSSAPTSRRSSSSASGAACSRPTTRAFARTTCAFESIVEAWRGKPEPTAKGRIAQEPSHVGR